MSIKSYASVAATGTPGQLPEPMKKKIDFVYQEDLPRVDSTKTRTREVTLIVNNVYNTTSEAETQFNLCDKGLEGLDTSGKISDYIVSTADGKTVNFRHRNDIQTVFIIYTISINYLINRNPNVYGKRLRP
jgi:hypothetical protein